MIVSSIQRLLARAAFICIAISFSTETLASRTGPIAYSISFGVPSLISAIDTTTYQPTGSGARVGNLVGAVIPAPNGRFVYVLNGAGYPPTSSVPDQGAVDVVVPNAGVLASVPVGRFPIAGVVSSNGTTLFVANFYDGTMSVIDTASNRNIATVDVGIGPQALVLDQANEYIYVACYHSITVVSAATLQIVRTISLVDAVSGIANDIKLSADGKMLYVAEADARAAVVFISIATGNIITTVYIV
jgi:YVTN family beta-propeller protein